MIYMHNLYSKFKTMTYQPTLLFEFDEPEEVVEKSKKRRLPGTSIEAHHSVKEMKEAHYVKIISALTLLKVGGTYEEISTLINLDKAQVNRRLSEMVLAGTIFNVGTTRKTISGRKAMVRQLTSLK
jgi:predicted restriction endonuclease